MDKKFKDYLKNIIGVVFLGSIIVIGNSIWLHTTHRLDTTLPVMLILLIIVFTYFYFRSPKK